MRLHYNIEPAFDFFRIDNECSCSLESLVLYAVLRGGTFVVTVLAVEKPNSNCRIVAVDFNFTKLREQKI